MRERERDDIARKIESLESEKIILEQQITAANAHIAELEKELGEMRRQLAGQQSELADTLVAEEEIANGEAASSEKINDLRLLHRDRAPKRQESLMAQRAPLAARETELVELVVARQADIAHYEGKISNQRTESSDSEAAIAQQRTRCQEAESRATKIAETRGSHLATIGEREAGLRTLRDSLSEAQDHRGQLQVRESQSQMQIDNLAENVERRYHVDLRAFAPDPTAFDKTLRLQLKRAEQETIPTSAGPHDNQLQKIISDLTRQLDNMGPVNLDAVQEYVTSWRNVTSFLSRKTPISLIRGESCSTLSLKLTPPRKNSSLTLLRRCGQISARCSLPNYSEAAGRIGR